MCVCACIHIFTLHPLIFSSILSTVCYLPSLASCSLTIPSLDTYIFGFICYCCHISVYYMYILPFVVFILVFFSFHSFRISHSLSHISHYWAMQTHTTHTEFFVLNLDSFAQLESTCTYIMSLFCTIYFVQSPCFVVTCCFVVVVVVFYHCRLYFFRFTLNCGRRRRRCWCLMFGLLCSHSIYLLQFFSAFIKFDYFYFFLPRCCSNVAVVCSYFGIVAGTSM